VVLDVLVADHSPTTIVGALHLRHCRDVVRDVVHVLVVQNHGVLGRLELALLAHPRRLGDTAAASFEVDKPDATTAAADYHDRNSLFSANPLVYSAFFGDEVSSACSSMI
jgi:hypothetical protein